MAPPISSIFVKLLSTFCVSLNKYGYLHMAGRESQRERTAEQGLTVRPFTHILPLPLRKVLSATLQMRKLRLIQNEVVKVTELAKAELRLDPSQTPEPP